LKNSPYLCFNKKARYSERYRKVDSDLPYKKRFKINLKNYPILFGELKNNPYLCIINLKTMKNLSVRLLILVSVGAIIYFVISNNTSEVKKEIVNITNEVDTISENVEEPENNDEKVETKKETTFNSFLIQGQINTYSNGVDTYIVELDTLDRIVITQPNNLTNGHFWTKDNCKFKNNQIYVDWITTEYYIKNNELIIVESGKATKFNLTETNF